MKRRSIDLFFRYFLFALLCAAPWPARGQAVAQQPPPAATPPPPAEKPSPDDTDKQTRFFDTVTVSATLNPSSIMETPSTVSVIDADTIARRMIENVADLVK